MSQDQKRTLRSLARSAKSRIKSGFWKECSKDVQEKLERARRQGINETRAGRFLMERVSASLNGDPEDEFYKKVKRILLEEGEISNAIGRLTDQAYYQTLSYEEKQRYNLSLSEKYLRALERFRKECEFDVLDSDN